MSTIVEDIDGHTTEIEASKGRVLVSNQRGHDSVRDFTPEQARGLAQTLIEAADRADGQVSD